MGKITKKQLQQCHNKLLNQFASLVRELKDSNLIDDTVCPTFTKTVRPISELTGNELCKTMLASGDRYVMCLVSDVSEESARHEGIVRVVCSYGADYYEDTTEDAWNFVVPSNNQGDPLPFSDDDLSSDLTGSDLCKAMLDRGDKYVMCLVNDKSEESAKNYERVRVICSRGCDYFDDTTEDMWYFAVPINSQGEPLTSKDVGLY